jgi:hypothetical protein
MGTKDKAVSMEREWFDWSGWDGDQEMMQFYNVVLNKKIGKLEAGTKFSSVCIDFSRSTIEFYDDMNEVVAKHRVSFAFGDELPL